MSNDRFRFLLEVVGRQEVIFLVHKGREVQPRTAGDQS